MDLAQIELRGRTLDSITTLAVNDAVSYAATILDESPPKIAAQLREAVPVVVGTYGEVASVASADWYETVRPTLGFNARPVTPPSIADDTASALGWALAPLFTETDGDVLTRLAGGLIRLVAGFDRETGAFNASRDPLATRSRRVAHPDACTFCAYMAVVSDNVHETTANYHDHCRCYPVPFWADAENPTLPKQDEWFNASELAREAILADYAEKRKLAPDLRMRNFYRKFPETAVNRKNILRHMRTILDLAH